MRLGDRGVLSPDTEALAGELVAFANAAGGGIFLGVADSGAVAGIAPARSRCPTARSSSQILVSYLSRTWSKRGRRRPVP